MAKRKRQRISNEFAEVGEEAKARALDQVRRVPWRRLADTVDEANGWETFNLWLRAIVDAARCIPPVVEGELNARIPGFLARIDSDMRVALTNDAPGHCLWNLVGSWMSTNVLREPKVHGWLEAVHYFSSMSLPYMTAWAHWERVNKEWRTNPPAEWPSFKQWQDDVAAVSRLANPDSVPQQVLNAVRSVSRGEWERLVSAFFDLVAFSMWLELVLDLEGLARWLVSEEIKKRYQGFSFSRSVLSSGEAVRELNSWAIDHALGVQDERLLAALSWHVRHHPRYYAIRCLAMHCHDVWANNQPSPLPSFDEWQREADNHTPDQNLSNFFV